VKDNEKPNTHREERKPRTNGHTEEGERYNLFYDGIQRLDHVEENAFVLVKTRARWQTTSGHHNDRSSQCCDAYRPKNTQ
jgi:hypothetical protein